jgi:4-amino-4-deoxy-L-arabinose transferase-like glycosyltransferase
VTHAAQQSRRFLIRDVNIWFGLALTGLLVVAAGLRFWRSERPGYDVDESLYARIAANLADEGFLGAKPEYIGDPQTYTSHPPFLFVVEAGWFKLVGGSSVIDARHLAAAAGVLTVLLVGVLFRPYLGYWSLLAAGLLAMDGWLVFTNRVGWAENLQIPLGMVLLMWFTRLVDESLSAKTLAAGGVALGFIVVYKQVGVCFLAAGLLYMLMMRSRLKDYVVVLASAGAVCVTYLIGMYLWAGPVFISDAYHQVLRVLGIEKSRGSVSSFSDVLGALSDNYRIYLSSVMILVVVGLIMIVRLWQCWRQRNWEPAFRADALLFSWTLATYVVFGLARLRLPHYLILLMVPAICYLVAELRHWVQGRDEADWRIGVTVLLASAVVVGGLVGSYGRLVLRNDNAVGKTIEWMALNAPPDSQVIADEFLGNQIRQPYCRITRAQACEREGGRPDYIITYTTRTQKLPDSQALDRMLGYGAVITSFKGFKEEIRIYRIAPETLRR